MIKNLVFVIQWKLRIMGMQSSKVLNVLVLKWSRDILWDGLVLRDQCLGLISVLRVRNNGHPGHLNLEGVTSRKRLGLRNETFHQSL